MAAFASAKPGRVPSPEQVAVDAPLAEHDGPSEALNGMAVELSLFGEGSAGLFGPCPHRVSAENKLEMLGLIDSAVRDGWANTRRRGVLDLQDVARAPRWRRAAGDREFQDGRPVGVRCPAAGLRRAGDP